ncbi:MAG: ATP-binding cassette domain-containing protein, partial [Flavobacteriales bacterium]|nr:ATP-binding cassette domain-containing protein [Flavobacteriales bacterium]
MLNISGLTLHFGQRTLFNNVALFIGDRECVGLTGKNGAGKSTLLRMIAGSQSPTAGTITLPKGATIGFLQQDMVHNEERTVLEEAGSAFDEIIRIEKRIEEITQEITDRTDFESPEYSRLIDELSDLNDRLSLMGGTSVEEKTQRILQGLGFTPDDMHRSLSEFSGGWKMRVELAKLLLQNPNLLLLDEPTNHLDIESREALVMALNEYSGAVILVSHDTHLVETVADRLWLVKDGRVTDFDDDMDAYKKLILSNRNKKGERKKDKGQKKTAPQPEQDNAAAPPKKVNLVHVQKSAQKLELELKKAGLQKDQIEAIMAEPDFYAKSTGEQIAEKTNALADITK